MAYNSYKQLEDIAKFFALQNEGFRSVYDITSKANVLVQVNSLMSQKAYWQKAATLIAAGAIRFSSMEESRKAFNDCYQHEFECDRELNRLAMDAIKDDAISKTAELFSHRFYHY